MPRTFDRSAARKAVDKARSKKRDSVPPLSPQEAAGESVGSGDNTLPATPAKPASEAASATTDQWGRDPRLIKDFRLLLTVLWRYLGLPDPTPIQLSVAWWLQHGPARAIILAFRGMAKSWITAAFVMWLLYCDPQKKVLVVSGSLKRAVAFTNFCLYLVMEVPQLAFLKPKRNQRQSAMAFDVGPSLPDQSPSFHASGIFGMLTGFRGDAIVPDDAETNMNSLTTVMREKLLEATKEFESVLKPGGIIKFLGTFHSIDSLYLKKEKQGYKIRIWPARYPRAKERRMYGERLAPFIRNRVKKDPDLVGTTTEPTRFTEDDLASRELAMGRTEFALQFMLNPSLADANKFPLRLSDLMVMGLDPKRGPDLVSYGRSEELRIDGLPLLGFDGDHFYRPAAVSETYSPWNEVYAWIDPSGRGADETALAIVAELHGIVYALHVNGFRDGYSPATLASLAAALVRFDVMTCEVEDEFGQGMFASLLKPNVEQAWKKVNKGRQRGSYGGTKIEGIRSAKVQKELRILQVMEPLTQAHRLVVDIKVIEEDYASVTSMDDEAVETRHRYALFHQYAYITREADCLGHDDRLEALAKACARFAERIGLDPGGAAAMAQDDRIEEELDRMFEEADDLQAGRGPAVGQAPKKLPTRPAAGRIGRGYIKPGKGTR
jgi:hypothetical protein